jgi:hypothetical protein
LCMRKKGGGALNGFSSREGGEKKGGVWPWGYHTVRGRRGAWLRPVGGVPTAARPRRALALTRGPRLSVGEGVRRDLRGARGPAQEGKGWAEPI